MENSSSTIYQSFNNVTEFLKACKQPDVDVKALIAKQDWDKLIKDKNDFNLILSEFSRGNLQPYYSDVLNTFAISRDKNYKRENILHTAAATDLENLQTLEIICESTPPDQLLEMINQKNYLGETPLIIALYTKKYLIANRLLDLGAANIGYYANKKPLELAQSYLKRDPDNKGLQQLVSKMEEIFKMRVNKATFLNYQSFYDVAEFLQACKQSDVDVGVLIAKQDWDKLIKDKNDFKLILSEFLRGNLEPYYSDVLNTLASNKELLEKIRDKNYKRENILHTVAATGLENLRTLEITRENTPSNQLLEMINQENNLGETPLIIALYTKKYLIANRLLDLGAANVGHYENKKPLELAQSYLERDPDNKGLQQLVSKMEEIFQTKVNNTKVSKTTPGVQYFQTVTDLSTQEDNTQFNHDSGAYSKPNSK